MTQNNTTTTAAAFRFDSATSKSGKELTLLSTVPGNTGKPDFNEFTPAKTRMDGSVVDPRFTTTLFVNEDVNGVKAVHKFKLTLWGDLAVSALKHLGAKETEEVKKAMQELGLQKLDRRVATIQLIGAVASPYTYEGEDKVSYSVNYESQIKILKLAEYAPNSFEAAFERLGAAPSDQEVPF